jgi:hypothetical protein
VVRLLHGAHQCEERNDLSPLLVPVACWWLAQAAPLILLVGGFSFSKFETRFTIFLEEIIQTSLPQGSTVFDIHQIL